jgi:hypothetical protein
VLHQGQHDAQLHVSGTRGTVLSALCDGIVVHLQCRSRMSVCSAAAAASTRARYSAPSVGQCPGTAA